MYRLTQSETTVHRLTDNAFIPFDGGNIDYQEYLEWLAAGNEPEPYQEHATLEDCKTDYEGRIDRDAEAARLRFVTPGSGMAMTYIEKFAQAQGVQAMGETAANELSQPNREAQFPILAASVGIEADTLWGVAQLVLQKYTMFAHAAHHIERARLFGKRAVRAALSADEVRASYEAVTWPTP